MKKLIAALMFIVSVSSNAEATITTTQRNLITGATAITLGTCCGIAYYNHKIKTLINNTEDPRKRRKFQTFLDGILHNKDKKNQEDEIDSNMNRLKKKIIIKSILVGAFAAAASGTAAFFIADRYIPKNRLLTLVGSINKNLDGKIVTALSRYKTINVNHVVALADILYLDGSHKVKNLYLDIEKTIINLRETNNELKNDVFSEYLESKYTDKIDTICDGLTDINKFIVEHNLRAHFYPTKAKTRKNIVPESSNFSFFQMFDDAFEAIRNVDIQHKRVPKHQITIQF